MSDAIETRHFGDAELRVTFGAGMRALIEGYAIVFNKLSLNLGGFREVIRPQAIERTLKEGIDVRALVDHETAKIIGRVSAKTLRLKADAKGLAVEIDPPNTGAARDVVESISRRDITGMSFAFRVMPDGDDWEMVDEMPIRHVLDMRVLEVSPVTFPAYPDTEVDVAAARSAAGSGIEAALASLAKWRAQPPRPHLAELEARQRRAMGG